MRQEACLGGLDVARLHLAFVTRGHFEGNLLAFRERFETGHVNTREVRKEVFSTAVRRNESETFCVVEPLNSSCSHL